MTPLSEYDAMRLRDQIRAKGIGVISQMSGLKPNAIWKAAAGGDTYESWKIRLVDATNAAQAEDFNADTIRRGPR